MTRLTPNFTLEELVHSDTAVRLGIDNTPPPDVVPRLVILAQGMEEIRAMLGGVPVNVHSGYRCEALERVLCEQDFGGWCRRHGMMPSEQSWKIYFARKGHPQGWCADWTARRFGTPRQCIQAIVQTRRVRFDQLIEEGTWAHASFDPRMRGQVLTASFDANGVPSYQEGLA